MGTERRSYEGIYQQWKREKPVLKRFQSLHSKYLGVNNPIVQCLYLEKGLFTVFCQEFDVK